MLRRSLASRFLAFFMSLASFVVLASTAEAALSSSSQDFVRRAATSNQFEIASSQLAADQSENPAVKEFAQQMITDHTQVGDDLTAALTSAGEDETAIPDTPDPKHRKVMDRLNAASGENFDRLYIQEQIRAHREAVALFQNYANKGDNASLKAFANHTLPSLKQHLQQVQKLQGAMKKQDG